MNLCRHHSPASALSRGGQVLNVVVALLLISAFRFPLSAFSSNVPVDDLGRVNSSTRQPVSTGAINYRPGQLKINGVPIDPTAAGAYAIDGIEPMLAHHDLTEKNLFTSRDDAGSAYTRNTSNFATVYGLDLTGVSVYNNSGTPTQTATLISPRHVLMANHYHPANGTQIRFVTAGNVVVNRTLTNSLQIGSTDLQIGILDSDVPNTIAFYKVLASPIEPNQIQRGILYLDQNENLYIADNTPASAGLIGIYQSTFPTRYDFWKLPVAGDSSHPLFFLLDKQPVLLASFFGSTTSPSVATNYAAINAAMTSLGTPYQLTPYNVPVLAPPSPPIAPLSAGATPTVRLTDGGSAQNGVGTTRLAIDLGLRRLYAEDGTTVALDFSDNTTLDLTGLSAGVSLNKVLAGDSLVDTTHIESDRLKALSHLYLTGSDYANNPPLGDLIIAAESTHGNPIITNSAATAEFGFETLTAYRKYIYPDADGAIGTAVAVPSTATSPGKAGQYAYSTTFFYICVATDTWRRVAIATW